MGTVFGSPILKKCGKKRCGIPWGSKVHDTWNHNGRITQEGTARGSGLTDMKSSHIVLSLCSKRTIGERQKHLGIFL